ncbi:MAG: hypothetical protein IJF33_03000, partial [Clostridia bacterium]|nr:hypothetical protein [Clostridia bacterium]
MRKILSWVLLACLILTMIPVSIMADGQQTTPTEPALKPAPEGAKPIATLADLIVTEEEAPNFKGDYYLPDDLYITLDMIDQYYAEKDPETGEIIVDLTKIENQATIQKDTNKDVIYYTAEGKIAYDTVNGVKKEKTDKNGAPVLDADGNPTYVTDSNGDVIYYKPSEDPTVEPTKIAYDTVTGTYKRLYSFDNPLITTDKGFKTEKIDTDGDGKTEDVLFWTPGKETVSLPLSIYGCGHSISFEKGIEFSGGGVLFNKMYGTINVYDLSIGTAENPVIFNSNFANIGVVAGGAESHTKTFAEEGKAEDTVSFDTIITFDNVDTYGVITDLRNGNNNIGGLIGKPNNGSGDGKKVEIYLLNCVTDVDITGDITKYNASKKAGYGAQYGGAIGTWIGDKLVIENTVNYGNMTADSKGESVAAGAAGGFVAISSSASV